MGMIALKLFPKTVDSLEHKCVQEFITILEGMAGAYNCKLKTFAIKEGVVLFSFDDEEIVKDLLEDMEQITGTPPTICDSAESFVKMAKRQFVCSR